MALSAYSSQCLQSLLSEFPEFAPFVTQEGDSFIIELTSPSGLPFWISSEGGELMVGFAEHHRHFGSFICPDALEDARDVAQYVTELRDSKTYNHRLG